jgi:hypothetical protein
MQWENASSPDCDAAVDVEAEVVVVARFATPDEGEPPPQPAASSANAAIAPAELRTSARGSFIAQTVERASIDGVARRRCLSTHSPG